MYLYNFWKEIEPLWTENPPKEIVSSPGEIVLESFVHRTIAKKYAPDLPAQGDYFQPVASLSEPTNITFRDVSPQVAYMNNFSLETCLLPSDENGMPSLSESAQACYEAACLFEYLTPVTKHNMNAKASPFEVFSSGGIEDIENPIIEDYGNNPINLRIYESQIIFFFAKYTECRFRGEKQIAVPENEFFRVMIDGITEYEKKGVCSNDFNKIICRNPELNDFISQLLAMESESDPISALSEQSSPGL